jgi:cell division protein ZapD
VQNKITYEFPLSERIRIFIRLEKLFLQLEHFVSGNTEWDKRAAINVLLDILTIFGRNDLKSEILKELDRHSTTLNQISSSEEVNTAKLKNILQELDRISKALYSASGKIGIAVMESDLFQNISQRSSIPGGSCSFDLPAFHYWLQQDESSKLKDLDRWTRPFNTIKTAIDLILSFIRDSSIPTAKIAEAGFFQLSLDQNQPYQLLRISIDRSLHRFVEISGGKHRFSVRFMTPSSNGARPTQGDEDIPFELTCCLF